MRKNMKYQRKALILFSIMLLLIIGITFSQDAEIPVDEDEREVFKNSNGEEIFTEIPEGHLVADMGNGKYGISNYGSTGTLRIGSSNIKLERRSSLIIEQTKGEDSGRIKIKIKGQADISVDVTRLNEGTIDSSGTDFNGIKDAIIEIDEEYREGDDGSISVSRQISFVRLTSIEGGEYSFLHNTGYYEFKLSKGGVLVFNPSGDEMDDVKGNTVKVLNGVLEWEDQSFNSDEMNINFDDNGNIISIEMNGENNEYIDSLGNLYSAKDELTIYIGVDKDISKEGNSVLINHDENKVFVKGKVAVNSANGLNYEGLREDAYTEIDTVKNHYDVKAGLASIDNGKHKLFVLDGVVKLENKNLDSKEIAESFSVSSSKDGKTLNANVDEVAGKMILRTQKQGEKAKISSVPLSLFEGEMGDAEVVQEQIITNLENEIKEELEGSGDLNKINALKLSLAMEKRVQNDNQGKSIEESIELFKEFLERAKYREMDPELEASANMILGGLYARGVYENPDMNQDISQAEKHYKAAQTIARESQNQELFESVTFAFAEAYQRTGRGLKANIEYQEIIHSTDSNEVKSQAYLGVADSLTDSGEYLYALQNLDKSLKNNPDNKDAQDSMVQLSLALTENIDRAVGGGMSELFEQFNDKLGIGSYESVTQTPGQALNLLWANAGNVILGDSSSALSAYERRNNELWRLRKGTIGLSALLIDGVRPEEFYNADSDNRFRMIRQALHADENGISDARVREVESATWRSIYGNSDFALIAARGDEEKARSFLRGRNAPEVEDDGRDDWNLRSFNFNSGDYIGEINRNWQDAVKQQLNIRTYLTIGAGGLVRGALTKGGRVIGLGKIIDKADDVTSIIGEATARNSVTKVGGFVGSEVGEEVLISGSRQLPGGEIIGTALEIALGGGETGKVLDSAGNVRRKGNINPRTGKLEGNELSQELAAASQRIRNKAGDLNIEGRPDIYPSGSGGCFLSNTQILMADNTYKDIQEILLGEEVIAYDIFNNFKTSSSVSKTFKRLETKYYHIEYEVIG